VSVKRDRYKAVSTQVSLLIPCLPGEAGEPATFLPALPTNNPLRVRALTFAEAETALRENHRHGERRYWTAVVALLEAIQSGNRESQELACQRLNLPPSEKGRDIAQSVVAEWLRNTPFSKIETLVAEDKTVRDQARNLMLAAIRALRPALEPNRLFCYEVTRTLFDRVRLVLWWDGQRFLPALYCEDRTTALYIRVLLKAAKGRGLATCLKCGEWFVQDRANQNYCSIAHREAHRVKRWRSHRKQLATRKGRKHGTRKAR
jgi:hypothetical protein